MLLLMYFTGARTGEVRQMKVEEIDRTGEDWIWRPKQHKTAHLGHDRHIVLGHKARKVLVSWLDGKADGDHVFVGRQGPYSRWGLPDAVNAAAEKAGVVGFFPYMCRHARKQAVEDALSTRHAAAALGHRTMKTTKRYAKNQDLRLAIEAARRLG
jgi:integrase